MNHSLPVIGHGEFRYTLDQDWGSLDPNQYPITNCHEMVRDAKNRLHLITDSPAANVLVYDESGNLLDCWGGEYPGGHGLTLFQTDEGEERLVIADCGTVHRRGEYVRQTGRVAITALDGRLILPLPHPHAIGAYSPDMPYKPTESAVAPNGDIYVADGYGSQHILHYDASGRFIQTFGELQNAHGVTLDTRDAANPMLICTSRKENAFKRYDLEGHYIDTIPLPGAFVCRANIEGDHLFTAVCWSRGPKGEMLDRSGFITILDPNFRVVSNPGGTAPVYKNGELQPMRQDQPVFHHCHDVTMDSAGNLIVCQWNAEGSTPIRLLRQSASLGTA